MSKAFSFPGLTQFGADGEVLVREQDACGAGQLSTLSVESGGSIVGQYTNGQTRTLGAIGVATFVNPEGRQQTAEKLFAQTTNSGAANLGAGQFAGRGHVVGGALENSNVDTAEQFVQLIQAQRGFQANARVITAENEVLRDTVSLI